MGVSGGGQKVYVEKVYVFFSAPEEMCTNFFFLHKRLEHPQGSGTSGQNSRNIPGSSLPDL